MVWGPSQSCGGYSESGTSSYCAVFDAGDETPWAACVDPACWWWQQSGLDLAEARGGVCVGPEQLRRRLVGILLRLPEGCAGTCRQVGELDGPALGYCDSECREGDRECLGGALYRECVKERWSTAAKTAPMVRLAHHSPPARTPTSSVEVGFAVRELSSGKTRNRPPTVR